MDGAEDIVATTRDRLVEETIAVLDAAGESAVRVRDIANRVGVALTSIYHFFGSRGGLIDAANGERYRRSFYDEGLEAVVGAMSTCASRDDMRVILESVIDRYSTPEGVRRREVRRAVLGSSVSSSGLLAMVAAVDAEYARILASLFAPAQQNGWVRRDIDLLAVARWQIAQMTSRAVVDVSDPLVDPDRYARIEREALVAVMMGEMPDS